MTEPTDGLLELFEWIEREIEKPYFIELMYGKPSDHKTATEVENAAKRNRDN